MGATVLLTKAFVPAVASARVLWKVSAPTGLLFVIRVVKLTTVEFSQTVILLPLIWGKSVIVTTISARGRQDAPTSGLAMAYT